MRELVVILPVLKYDMNFAIILFDIANARGHFCFPFLAARVWKQHLWH